MSKLLEQMKKDQLQARKDRDTFTASKLTTLIGEASPSGNETVTDKEVQKVVQKFIKGVEQNLEYLSSPQHADALWEIKLYEQYLPKQLTAEEIEYILSSEMTVYLDSEGKGTNIGTVMGFLNSNYPGQFDGKTASKVAKEFIDSFKKFR